jgi:hypothetical protein
LHPGAATRNIRRGMAGTGRQLRATIDRALEDGATLADVERLLDEAAIADDLRDALWLYAWGAAERLRPVALTA